LQYFTEFHREPPILWKAVNFAVRVTAYKFNNFNTSDVQWLCPVIL